MTRHRSNSGGRSSDEFLDEDSPAGEAQQPTQRKKPRSRRMVTQAQSDALNALLAQTPFPSGQERDELAGRIGMTPRQVQVWFQNRRQNIRSAQLRARQAKDQGADPDAAVRSLLPPAVKALPEGSWATPLRDGRRAPVVPPAMSMALGQGWQQLQSQPLGRPQSTGSRTLAEAYASFPPLPPAPQQSARPRSVSYPQQQPHWPVQLEAPRPPPVTRHRYEEQYDFDATHGHSYTYQDPNAARQPTYVARDTYRLPLPTPPTFRPSDILDPEPHPGATTRPNLRLPSFAELTRDLDRMGRY